MNPITFIQETLDRWGTEPTDPEYGWTPDDMDAARAQGWRLESYVLTFSSTTKTQVEFKIMPLRSREKQVGAWVVHDTNYKWELDCRAAHDFVDALAHKGDALALKALSIIVRRAMETTT
jgi:hypothetical protein